MWVLLALLAEVFGIRGAYETSVHEQELGSLRRRIAELETSQVRLSADYKRLSSENADLREIVDYFVREDGGFK